MESHSDFLFYLAIASSRSLFLGLLTWLTLRLCRVRAASMKHAVWTIVTAVMLLQSVISPVLPALPLRVLAPAPAADTAQGRTLPLPLGPSSTIARNVMRGNLMTGSAPSGECRINI